MSYLAFLHTNTLGILSNWIFVWFFLLLSCVGYLKTRKMRVLSLWKFILVFQLCCFLYDWLGDAFRPPADIFFGQIALEYTIVSALCFGTCALVWWLLEKKTYKPDWQGNLVVLHGWFLMSLLVYIVVP